MTDSAHEIPDLDRKGLREFGLTTGGIVAGLFGLFFPWLLDRPWPTWPWVFLAVLGGLGILAPMSLRPVYRLWMKFGLMMSKITTPVIMAVVFFVVVTPMALVMKMLGKDYMMRCFDQSASYRVQSRRTTPDSLKRPY